MISVSTIPKSQGIFTEVKEKSGKGQGKSVNCQEEVKEKSGKSQGM